MAVQERPECSGPPPDGHPVVSHKILPSRPSEVCSVIPKILHQTCKDRAQLPRRWLEFQQSWLRLHPTWEYRCWDDQDNAAFVRAEYPVFYQLFLDLPKPINRVDLCKFLYLHRYGGVVADFDCEALRPIDDLLEVPGKRIVLGEKLFVGKGYVECALLASAPSESFWMYVVARIQQIVYHPSRLHRWSSVLPSLTVIMTTGPLMLTDVLNNVSQKHREVIQIYPEEYFFPDPTQPIPHQSYTVHYCDSTWLSGIDKPFASLQRSSTGQAALLAICAVATVVVVIIAVLLILWCAFVMRKCAAHQHTTIHPIHPIAQPNSSTQLQIPADAQHQLYIANANHSVPTPIIPHMLHVWPTMLVSSVNSGNTGQDVLSGLYHHATV
jgi:mannosyltransferase OCH1-like enzyme